MTYIPYKKRTLYSDDKYHCEEGINGILDDYGHCQIPDSKLSQVLAITGFGTVRTYKRMSKVLEKMVEIPLPHGGKKNAIVKSKGLGFEALVNVNVSNDLFERWIDTYKVKPEMEGKKSKIKMINVDILDGRDTDRLFIAINEPAIERWKKKWIAKE